MDVEEGKEVEVKGQENKFNKIIAEISVNLGKQLVI
jgi:hypothetical protein